MITGGTKRAFATMEIGIKKQIFLAKPEVGIKLRLIDLILAMTVFLPVWHSHCTRVRFTVIVSCSDEFTVHSCPLLCLQRQFAKVSNRLLYCWSIMRNNTMVANLQKFTLYYGSRCLAAWDCWKHTSWQVMQRDSDMLIAVKPRTFILCE